MATGTRMDFAKTKKGKNLKNERQKSPTEAK